MRDEEQGNNAHQPQERVEVIWLDSQSPLCSSNVRINDTLLSLIGAPIQSTTNLNPVAVFRQGLSKARQTKKAN